MEEHACNSGGEYRRGRSTRPAVANEVANKTIALGVEGQGQEDP